MASSSLSAFRCNGNEYQYTGDADVHMLGPDDNRYQLPKIPEVSSSDLPVYYPVDGAGDAHGPPPPPPPPPSSQRHSGGGGGVQSAHLQEVPGYEMAGAIPGYDIERDAGSIPLYTRTHLHKLSEGIHARLMDLDDALETNHHHRSHHLLKGREHHEHVRSTAAHGFLRGLYYILLVLGIVWSIMSIISLVAYLRNRW
ncbi:hypothetical protein F5Y17DRAFT_448457 [Xylariaceae sp. FL0594]|nr:hypothetical protein F5Y17DRAFT_448457 [Xylariaceae sp. FL0594]